MKSWPFALGLALCCIMQAEWNQVTAASNKDMGSWISSAAACNSSFGLEQMRHTSAFIAKVSQLEEGVLNVLVFIHMPDGCKKTTYQFKEEEDGKYYGFLDDTEVIVEIMKFLDKYAISIINVQNKFKTTILHGPEVIQDPEILKKFKDECKTLGYKEEEIVVFNPTVKCPQE